MGRKAEGQPRALVETPGESVQDGDVPGHEVGKRLACAWSVHPVGSVDPAQRRNLFCVASICASSTFFHADRAVDGARPNLTEGSGSVSTMDPVSGATTDTRNIRVPASITAGQASGRAVGYEFRSERLDQCERSAMVQSHRSTLRDRAARTSRRYFPRHLFYLRYRLRQAMTFAHGMGLGSRRGLSLGATGAETESGLMERGDVRLR